MSRRWCPLLVAGVLTISSSCGPPASERRAAPGPPPSPAGVVVRALILGADGAPRRNRPVVKIDDRSAMADPQGLVEFGGIRRGRHVLSASDGSSLDLRRGAERSVPWIDFEVKQPTGSLDLGTVLAESYAEAKARRTAAFGPACDAVVAGRRPPAPLPAEDLPACLERDAGGPWDDKACGGGLGHLQLLARQ